MRGFDKFRTLPGVAIADSPAAFSEAVRRALADGSPASRGPAAVAGLTWDATLAPLVALISELLDATATCRTLTPMACKTFLDRKMQE
jgi:hypothetical protein